MPVHLEPQELRGLILSVGTHKADRPLSPLEVGILVRQATLRGSDLKEIAKATQLEGTTQLSRFMKLLELPQDTHHLVDWGRSTGGGVGFSTAFEIARLDSADDKRAAMVAAIEHGLSSAEARSLVQLRRRGAKTIADCIAATVKMRPTVEIRRVIIGAVNDPEVRTQLATKTQVERDKLITTWTHQRGLRDPKIVAKLAPDSFTIAGPDALLAPVVSAAESFEAELNTSLAQQLKGRDV
jgi:hypothetical protein